MKTKKKNRFWTFIFSCMPGAGEMYMGFMNRGVSMMLLFVLTIVVSVWLEQAALMAVCIVEWFYSFFYVNHLASLSDMDFAMVEDKSIFAVSGIQMPEADGFVNKYSKGIACVLIFLGGCFLWNTFARILSRILPDQFDFIARAMRVVGDYLPSIAIGFAIIFLGVKMLEGKKVEVVSDVEVKESKAYEAYAPENPKNADIKEAAQGGEKMQERQERQQENQEGM